MADFSVDEIIAAINHSKLPTVFVEGPEDMFVFNRIEESLGSMRANFFACGDRKILLEVYGRRGEITNTSFCFLADKDMWFFSKVPHEYAEVIFTHGYSIENDLYNDSDIENVLNAEERKTHALLIHGVSEWFAFEVDKYLQNGEYRSDPILSRLVPIPGFDCCPKYLNEIGFYKPPKELEGFISQNYKMAFRGKLLFEIIVRFTHAPQRKKRKYSYDALIELSVVYGLKGKLVSQLIKLIKEKLKIPDDPTQLPLGV